MCLRRSSRQMWDANFFFYFILVLQSSHVIYYVWIECGPGESLYWRWRQGSRSHSLFSGQKFLCCVIHPVLTTLCCAQLLLIWVNLIRTTNIAQIELFFFLLSVPIPILDVCVINTLTVYVSVFVCILVRINNWLRLIEMRSPF